MGIRSPGRARLPGPAREDGFTLVELLVGVSILAVGVLGTLSMVEGAANTTSTNKAREGATALARQVVEVTRSIPYEGLTEAAITPALQSRPALADSSPAAGYTIARRGYVYTVEVSACSIDDGKDGYGAHTGAVTFCSDSTTTGTKDRNSDDSRRMRVAVTWERRGRTERNRQATIVTNPVGAFGPTVSEVRLTSPVVPDPLNPTITTDVAQATFQVTLTTTPATVDWSLDGDAQGPATGTGTTWTIDWPLSSRPDGSYTVQAEGYDDEGRSGVAYKLPVIVNRRVPPAPTGFAGGRNLNGSDVDLEWNASPEGDVLGYRVYRTDSSGTIVERACPPASDPAGAYLTTASCVQLGAPSSGTIYYKAVAVDAAPDGTLREGTATAVKSIGGLNARPTIPVDLVACAGGAPLCTLPDGSAAPSGTTVVLWVTSLDLDLGDSVVSYRIYRDGTAYSARYGRVYSNAIALKFVDTAPGGTTHTYRVTAVDSRYGESLQSLAVTG